MNAWSWLPPASVALPALLDYYPGLGGIKLCAFRENREIHELVENVSR